MKTYLISEEKLKKLLKRHIELEILECAGVDNWDTPQSIVEQYGEEWELELPTEEVLEKELSNFTVYTP